MLLRSFSCNSFVKLSFLNITQSILMYPKHSLIKGLHCNIYTDQCQNPSVEKFSTVNCQYFSYFWMKTDFQSFSFAKILKGIEISEDLRKVMT